MLAFDDAIVESADFHAIVPNGYSGSDVTVDVYWAAASAAVGQIMWGVAVERIAPGSISLDVPSFSAERTGTSTAPAQVGRVVVTSIVFTNAQAGGLVAGDPVRLRVRRRSDVAPVPRMAGDAHLLHVLARQ